MREEKFPIKWCRSSQWGPSFVECDVDPKSWRALPLAGPSYKFLRGAIHPATIAVEGPEANECSAPHWGCSAASGP